MSIDIQSTDEVLLVTGRQAAKMLSISERTLWTLTHQKEELSCIMVGRKKLYELAELKRWIESRKFTGDTQCNFPGRADNTKQS